MSLGALVHALQHVKVLKAHQLVCLRLADHATDNGLSWPSHSLLARETGYTRQYVIRVIEDLLQEGVIREVFDAKGRRRYQLPVYDFKHKQCGCEQPDPNCQLSLQAPESTCKLSSAGVNSASPKSCHANENPTEPLQEEPEKMQAHMREVEEASVALAPTEDKAEAQSPYWCANCGVSDPNCAHRTIYYGDIRAEGITPHARR